MTIEEKIRKDESEYERQLQRIADRITADNTIMLVLIAGPSCSGKTTTSDKLAKALLQRGCTSYRISIDDFYKDYEDIVPDASGHVDLESIESIDLVSLHEVLTNLCSGKKAEIPRFDFESRRRAGVQAVIQLGKNDVALLEGLHALNPVIYRQYVKQNQVFRIFLDAYAPTESGQNAEKDDRLIRRLVRDFNFRFADAAKTFSMWHSVTSGEKKYIYPYANQADVTINTYFDYEPSVLKDRAEDILQRLPAGNAYRADADRLMKKIADAGTASPAYVPRESLLREFIGDAGLPPNKAFSVAESK